jgi:hypothetical protein
VRVVGEGSVGTCVMCVGELVVLLRMRSPILIPHILCDTIWEQAAHQRVCRIETSARAG